MSNVSTLSNAKIDAGDKRFASPARELSFVIKFVGRIYDDLKPGRFHSKEDIASIHGLAVNSIKSLLSAAQQYNLLELKYGVGYKVSALFEKIYQPLNEEEKKKAILESLTSPTIYNEILTEYNGKVFPEKQELNEFISKKYDVKNSVSGRIVETFLQNLKEFKLLNDDNILSLHLFETKTSEKETELPFEKSKEGLIAKMPIPESENENANSGTIDIIIPLKSKLRAILTVPEQHTNADLEKIARIVLAYKEVAD